MTGTNPNKLNLHGEFQEVVFPLVATSNQKKSSVDQVTLMELSTSQESKSRVVSRLDGVVSFMLFNEVRPWADNVHRPRATFH